MDIKCRSCLATTDAKMYHSLSATFPDYFKTTLTVLEVLELVTSTSIPEFDSPNSICSACLKKLKESYSFVDEFRKSQLWIEENLTQEITEEKFTLKVDETQEENSDGEDNLAESFILQIESEEEQAVPLEARLNYIENRLKESNKRSQRQKTLNVVKRKRCGKKQTYGLGPVQKNEDGIIVMTIDDVLTEKERTKSLLENKNSDGDPLNIDKPPQMKQEIVTYDDHTYIKKTDEEKCHVMSLEDVLNDCRRPRNSNPAEGKRKKAITEPAITINRKIIKAENENVPHICEICNNIYKSLRALKAHKHAVHVENKLEKLKCDICGLQCKTRSSYAHHLHKHKGKQIPCDECPKVFLTTTQLKYHKLGSHQGGLPARFLCNQCGKRFKYVNALIYHEVSTHQIGEKQHMCRFCGFKCVQKSYLKRHERCHTDERPYKCKECNRSFRGRSEWLSHDMAHKGITKYECKYCGKGFVQSWNRKVHWLQHEGEYGCQLCSKSFVSEEVLTFHYSFQHKFRVQGIQDLKKDENEYVNSNDDTQDNSDLEYVQAESIKLDDELDFD